MLSWNEENRFALLVGGTSALVLLVDNKHGVVRDGFLEPAWTLLLYVAFPLLICAFSEAKKRAAAWSLAALGLVCVVVPTVHRAWMDGGRRYYFQNKEHMVALALLSLALALLAARVGRVDLRKWGLGLGDWTWWVPRMGVLFVAIVPLIGLGAWLSPELREFYPEVEYARESVSGLVRYQLGNGVYMAAWEWFFRGFLLFGIYRYWGMIPAILIQAYPFMLMHKAKPELEMAASFVGAILLGLFCLRARCFWPAFLLHWVLNMNMEIVGFIW